jgi:serine/threonine protein kinase
MLKDMEDVESDKIKICDFGLATHVDVKEYLYKRCGTPGYVCPEVVNADANDNNFRVNSKCDSFSAGVVMYLLLSSRPITTSWHHSVSRRHIQRDPQKNV